MYTYWWTQSIRPVSWSFMGRCYGNQFLASIGENVHTDLHSLRWHSTTDRRSQHGWARLHRRWPSYVWQKYGELWSSNLSFAGAFVPGGLHAGLCHAFLVVIAKRLVSVYHQAAFSAPYRLLSILWHFYPSCGDPVAQSVHCVSVHVFIRNLSDRINTDLHVWKDGSPWHYLGQGHLSRKWNIKKTVLATCKKCILEFKTVTK